MIRIETEHLRLTRILLLVIGVWPYDRSLFTQIRFTLLFAILITSIIFQLTALSTPECTITLAIKILSCAATFSVFALKYTSFVINSYTVRYLIEYLKNICNDLKDENEISIMKHYGSITTRYTSRLVWLTVVCIFLVILITTWEYLLDIVLLTNGTRPAVKLPIVMYYFVEEEKYQALILLHIGVAMCIGTIAVVATGTMLIAYFKHACAILSIARYRIQQTIDRSESNKLENTTEISKRITYAVDVHRKALEFCVILISNFEGSFLLLIIFLVIGLSLNLFAVFQAIVNEGDAREFLIHIIYAIPLFLYAMICNYVTQEVMDRNNDVFVTVYDIHWYRAPLKIQKIILFLLQRGNKSFILILGGIYVASVESAGKMMRASISYFTVLYSTQ